jgi:hypothetical protein
MWAIRRLHEEPVDFEDPDSIRAGIISAFGDGFEYGVKMEVRSDEPVFAAKHVSLKQGADGKLLLTLELDALESAPNYKVLPVNPAAVRAARPVSDAPAALEERHIRFLRKLQIAGCSCMTKTPEIQYHAADCQYRLAAEIERHLATAQSIVPAGAPEAGATAPAPDAAYATPLTPEGWKWVPVEPDGAMLAAGMRYTLGYPHQIKAVFEAMVKAASVPPTASRAATTETPVAWLWYEPASEWNAYEGRYRVGLQKPKVGADCRDIQALVRQGIGEGN